MLDATLVNTQNTGEYLCAVQIATVGPTGERQWLLRGYMLSRFEHCNGCDRSDIRRTPQTMDRLLRARRKTIKCKSRFRLEVRDGEIVDVILIIISIQTHWAVPCSERDVMRRNPERSTYPENENYSTNAYGITARVLFPRLECEIYIFNTYLYLGIFFYFTTVRLVSVYRSWYNYYQTSTICIWSAKLTVSGYWTLQDTTRLGNF